LGVVIDVIDLKFVSETNLFDEVSKSDWLKMTNQEKASKVEELHDNNLLDLHKRDFYLNGHTKLFVLDNLGLKEFYSVKPNEAIKSLCNEMNILSKEVSKLKEEISEKTEKTFKENQNAIVTMYLIENNETLKHLFNSNPEIVKQIS
jgi:hypothetical protein